MLLIQDERIAIQNTVMHITLERAFDYFYPSTKRKMNALG